MMFEKALIFISGIAAGVLVYDTAARRTEPPDFRIHSYTIKQSDVRPMRHPIGGK